MRVIPIRPEKPVPHECPRCHRMVRWALMYCASCARRTNPIYRKELDRGRIRQ